MQPGVLFLPKDRGAEQGDVDGPLECALTLGQVAKETATAVHQLQRDGKLEWANTQADLEASQGSPSWPGLKQSKDHKWGLMTGTRLRPNELP